jgi:hypothetical protein
MSFVVPLPHDGDRAMIFSVKNVYSLAYARAGTMQTALAMLNMRQRKIGG